MNILADELAKLYEKVPPMEFYREVFPEGELDEYRENPKQREEHRYTGIIVEVTDEKKKNGKPRIKRYTVTDELDEIDGAIWSDNFCVLAPISYVGKSRKSENARVMYGLVVELDNLLVGKDGTQKGSKNLIGQWSEKTHWIPNRPIQLQVGTDCTCITSLSKAFRCFRTWLKSFKPISESLPR